MKGKWYLGLLSFVLILFLASCGGTDESSGDSHSEGDSSDDKATTSSERNIVVAVAQNFLSMDPQNTGDANSRTAQRSMFEGLLGLDKDGGIIHVLATDHSISEDGLEYTFQLREGVTFHDGTDFNAEVAKANIDRMTNQDNGIRANRSFEFVDETIVTGDYEIKVILKNPYSSMLDKFATSQMISSESLKLSDDEISKNPIGTGPFKFVSWDQGSSLVVEAYDNYWEEGLPKVAGVEYRPTPENGTRLALLKTGEADFIFPYPEQNMSEADSTDDFTVELTPSTIQNYVTMNTNKEPFNNPKVRQAINHAIDNEAFINVVKSGLGNPLDSIITKQTKHYESQGLYEFNPEKAKELLAEAGYADGFNTTIWGNTSSDNMRAMQFIQQQLGAVGIEVEVMSMEEGTLSEKIYGAENPDDAEVDMWYVTWAASPNDTDHAIRPLFSSQMFPPAGANSAYYVNEEVTEWINAARTSADPEEQKELYSKIQKQIYEDAPWIFLAEGVVSGGKRAEVDGIYNLSSGAVEVREAEIKK
ncbi:glutathione ABC transporter substrate-binding protein [Alkalihalobacillus pseudalcaliphilus]|uniref:glutathione ABC transporter substrate-binding protein n=1 Tax=Alkalihalobacillus pseudalcaliphilus TaxID=79884 RepID=UPI00064D72F5|nr:glutathione ABC transporter substrate-binding protein [Alkalihalobacillus pseudalcaliphilus]KMK75163.1 glutathione ABC transporter substrate-binding protein [Alkalihalobacillus pseudalcaliphilus]